jgi:hypothetical protein
MQGSAGKPQRPAPGPVIICVVFLLIGCATVNTSDSAGRRFFDRLNRYPSATDALKIPKLTGTALSAIPGSAAASGDVFILVHPAYSLFFRDGTKSRYTEAHYGLLSRQFDNEARFIAEAARTGEIVILIIPGDYAGESTAPLSYTAYLNATASQGPAVFDLSSESVSSGAIAMNDMVDLYRFLQGVQAGKVLIGGGYIGRCQREFFNEMTAYFDKSSTYIVPEISTISPDDISGTEAASILESINRQDYRPVRKFIEKKLNKAANLLSIPQKKEL